MIHRSCWIIGIAACASLMASCAAGAYGQAELAAGRGDWDAAVEHYRQALQEHPSRAEYRTALERAQRTAAWEHVDAAAAHAEGGELEAALDEYRLAAAFDPSNGRAVEGLESVTRELREQAGRPRSRTLEDTRREPVGSRTDLTPLSREPLDIRFTDASLREVIDFIADAAGINVLYDPQFQDRPVTIRLDGLTPTEALGLILTANGYFYKVLDARAVGVGPR